jgi:hypothetical protein
MVCQGNDSGANWSTDVFFMVRQGYQTLISGFKYTKSINLKYKLTKKTKKYK